MDYSDMPLSWLKHLEEAAVLFLKDYKNERVEANLVKVREAIKGKEDELDQD